VLNNSPAPHPGVKMSHHGNQSKPKDAIELIKSAQAGATLIVENIDRYDEKLGGFLCELSEEIKENTRLNLYLSYPGEQGYDLHYDTQDFFILQIAGFKKWWIFPTTVESPLFEQKTHGIEPPPESSLYLNCTLGPGDVLYVPRGHWHYALAEKEPSMHLTLAVFVKTGIDFFSWITDELREIEPFRRNFPMRYKGEAVDIATETITKKHIIDLASRLATLLAKPDIYDRFCQFRVACDKNRRPFHFPNHLNTWTGATGAINIFRRPHQVSEVFPDPISGKIQIACGGRILKFDAVTEKALRFIFSSEQFSTNELAKAFPDFTWPQLASILSPLIREGFLVPEIQ
jgi:hypothetical protein